MFPLLFVYLLPGCSNALMFYETGKLSLTIEGKPDSSQPVQANLGFKQRTAVVAPPMRKGDTMANASSMISSFRVHKQSGWGPLTMRTALVTGTAARELDRDTAVGVAEALSGVPLTFNDDPSAKALRGQIRSWLETDGNRERLREWLEAKGLPEPAPGAIGSWLPSAATSDLRDAIRDLDIP
jgi:hypothetical protein